jgi:hypothetical protein
VLHACNSSTFETKADQKFKASLSYAVRLSQKKKNKKKTKKKNKAEHGG